MAHTISTGDDVIDSRDIQKRINELADMLAGIDDENRQNYVGEIVELMVWDALKEETEGAGWEYGIAFIREGYMEDYARETAEDIYGKELSESHWPFTCIDWEQATEEFKMDYSSIEIYGVDYWYREA